MIKLRDVFDTIVKMSGKDTKITLEYMVDDQRISVSVIGFGADPINDTITLYMEQKES